MIDRDLASHLARRFSGLPGWPREDAAREALTDAFEQAPRDDAHAAQVAGDLSIECHRCPVPADVWRAARASDPAQWWSKPPQPELSLDETIREHREFLESRGVIDVAKQLGARPEDLWGSVAEAEATWRERHTKLVRRRGPQRESAPAAAERAVTA
jgi:hypothetical protein